MQDRMYHLIAPHRSHIIAALSNLDFKRENALKRAEQCLSHGSQLGHIIIVGLWQAKLAVPVQPLVDSDGHDRVRDRICNTVGSGTPGILCIDFLICQAVKEVREVEHEFLNVASVDNLRLLLSFFAWRSESLKECHYGLVSEAHECGVIGLKAAA